MEIPEELADKVRQLEAERRQVVERREQTETQYEEMKRQYEDVQEELTFRDKYLGGLFGGDVSRVQEANALSDKLDALEDESEHYNDESASLNQEIRERIHNYLREQDPDYRALVERQEHLETVSQYLDDYWTAIELALDAVADAKEAEGIDFFTDSLFVDAWSSEKNDTVEDAMDTVAQRRTALKQVVAQYEAGAIPDEAISADLPSLAIDIVLDVFSVDSILAYGELDKASSTLKELEKEYEQVSEQVRQEYEETQTARERRLEAVKTEILDDGERTGRGY